MNTNHSIEGAAYLPFNEDKNCRFISENNSSECHSVNDNNNNIRENNDFSLLRSLEEKWEKIEQEKKLKYFYSRENDNKNPNRKKNKFDKIITKNKNPKL